MGTHLRWVIALLSTLAMGQAAAQTYSNPGYAYGSDYGYGQQRTVRCESIGSRRTFCRVNTMGRVQISRQLSQRSCIQGRNWSYSSSGIWVTNGCRADFVVGRRNAYPQNNGYGNAEAGHSHYVDSSGQLIHCVATASGRNYCGDSHSRYSMSGNRDPDCIEGQTWGTDERGVWVSGDCNADFTSSPDDNAEAGHSHYVDSSGQIIHCQSTADGRNYCGDQHTRYTMSGNRDPDCIEGQTYGFDERGTWVSGDCDADFSMDSNDSEYEHHH